LPKNANNTGEFPRNGKKFDYLPNDFCHFAYQVNFDRSENFCLCILDGIATNLPAFFT